MGEDFLKVSYSAGRLIAEEDSYRTKQIKNKIRQIQSYLDELKKLLDMEGEE